MSFRTLETGVIEVSYATAEDMAPEAQKALRQAIEGASRTARVALIFRVGRLPKVDPAVPLFWLEVTKNLSPNLCAMAIVSDSIAVRSAARGFGVANALRSIAVDVKAWVHGELDEAMTWLRDVLLAAQPQVR